HAYLGLCTHRRRGGSRPRLRLVRIPPLQVRRLCGGGAPCHRERPHRPISRAAHFVISRHGPVTRQPIRLPMTLDHSYKGEPTVNDPFPLSVLEHAQAVSAGNADGRVPVLSTRASLEHLPAAVISAELLATAHGVYEASLNGSPVTDSVLNPVWTVYESRLQIQRFAFTEQGRAGGPWTDRSAVLAPGCWNGDFGFLDAAANYGDENAFLAAHDRTFEDGTFQTSVTDESWTATDSP